MNKAHHRKLLSIFILDTVFLRLRKLRQKLTSISDEDMLAVKEFIDDISIELPQLLMDNDQKQHLVQYLISPYKNQSKIEIIQGLMNTKYLISRTTMNTATCMQYMELTPLSSKSTDKESHMYFCKDGSITLKLEEEVNPFVTYSSFLMYHQDQNHGDQDHGDHDHENQDTIMHFFSFYSQLFSNSFSFILTNTGYDNKTYKTMLEKTFDMAIINLHIHLQHNLGTSKLNPDNIRRLHSRYSKLELKMKKLTKEVLPLHSISYYYVLDPRYRILEDIEDINAEHIYLYFENQNLIKEDEQEIYVKHSQQLFYQYDLMSLDDFEDEDEHEDEDDEHEDPTTSTTPSLYERRYRLHREKWISRDPLCFYNGFLHCQLQALDTNVKQLLNLCLVTVMKYNLLEFYNMNGTRVITFDFCQGNISFSLPEQTQSSFSSSSSSSSTDPEIFIDIIEKSFDEEYQKEQEVLRKKLSRLASKKNNKLQLYGTNEFVVHQRDNLFVYQNESLSLDDVYEKVLKTHLNDTIYIKDVLNAIHSFDEELQNTTCDLIYKITHHRNRINAERLIGDTISELANRRHCSTTENLTESSSCYYVHPLLDLHEKTIRVVNKEYDTKEKQKQIYMQLQAGSAFDNFSVY